MRKVKDELEYTEGFLASVMRKLENERFVKNAPPAVIQTERRKKSDAEKKIKALKEREAELVRLKN